VHGDIWPNNIMVKDDGSIVLIDLGDSFFLDLFFEGPPHSRYTHPHPYCAPERRLPSGRWGIGADIYALGGVFLFLATGHSPPPKPITDEDKLKDYIFTLVNKHNPQLLTSNPGVVDIIAHCLRAGLHRRSPHAQAVLRDLATFDPQNKRPDIVKLYKDLLKEVRTLRALWILLRIAYEQDFTAGHRTHKRCCEI